MSDIDNTASGLKGQIEAEIKQYLTEVVNIGENHEFSQAKLVRRISLFESHIYPTGKFDSQGNYKFWFDVITPAIDDEVKNVDFDTKDVTVYSPRKVDELPCIICNLALKDYMRNAGQAEEINSAIEEGAGWGNILWKKVKGSYERCDLRNTYIINQTARTVDETPIIERHPMIQSDLRAKAGVWENIPEVIQQCGTNTYKSTAENQESDTTVPYYEIYERNGEISVKDLKEVHKEKPAKGDEDKYVFARVVAAGKKGQATGVSIEYILFAEEMPGKKNSKIYKEYHRGRYKGRWWREGLYELLFDIQVRANQIGNQIAQGLEYASKTWFQTEDKLIYNNILTDLKNGDVIKSTKGVKQVEVRMQGLDQLIADWNRLMQMRNEIANSREVVQGDALPSGTPLGAYSMVNVNANKLYVFIREKLAIPFSQIFDEWWLPEMVRDITAQDVLRLTGDSDMLKRLQQVIVDAWYIDNLIAIGPHDDAMRDALKAEKLDELTKRPQLLMTGIRALFKGFEGQACVEITGESLNVDADVQTLSGLAQMEADPVRRQAIIELIARKKGVDFGALPKSAPEQLMGPVSSPYQPSPLPAKQPTK